MIASGINIGRRRGEFEAATRAMRSAGGGHRTADAAGVCGIARLADLYARGSAKFCSQDKDGRHADGVPDELWLRENPPADGHEAGFTGRALEQEQMHVFMTETVDLTVRGGHVTTKRGDRLLCWCEPELFAALGQKYRLTVRFDPSEPSLGAAVFNRELGAPNRFGFTLGQFLGIAEYAPAAPQVTTGLGLLTPDEDAALTHKKRFDSAVRAEYRSIGVFGMRQRKTSERRDGRGNVIAAEVGAGATPTALAAAATVKDQDLRTSGTARERRGGLRATAGADAGSGLPDRSRDLAPAAVKVLNRFDLVEA